MMNRTHPTLRLTLAMLAFMLVLGPASAQYGGERAGTAGFQSLQLPVDARGAALGQTSVTMADDGSSLFWNPALAALATTETPYAVSFATTRYHAETALHYVSAIARIRTFHVGLSLQAFDGGRMEETTELQPSGTGRTFGYLEWAAGLTVSQKLTDLFSYGITGKFVQMSTIGVSAQTAVLDLGVHYQVGDTGAKIGVAIRNFGVGSASPAGEVEIVNPDGTVETIDTFTRITPPTQFFLGISYDAIQTAQHDLTVAAQLSNPADNQERFGVGAEYTWNDLLILRGGYVVGVDEGTVPSLGFGVHVPQFGGPRLRVDYAFNTLDRLGSVHRVGVDLRF
ncbi:hypothetical protein BH23BAC4_BH23BAC4_00380 [soil metagenome]